MRHELTVNGKARRRERQRNQRLIFTGEEVSSCQVKRKSFDPNASEYRARRVAVQRSAREMADEMRISIGRYFRLELDPAGSPHGLVLALDETLRRIEQRTAGGA